MKLPHSLTSLGLILARCALAITVAEITGNRYLSPFRESSFTNLTGLITFIGFFTSIRSLEPDDDESTSESIGILGAQFGFDHAIGDIVTIDGNVWGNDQPWMVFLPPTEITSPRNVRIVSRGNPVEPVPIGASTSGIIGNKELRPPTEQYNKLDNGDVFGVPNNVARVSELNPELQPRKYGMDFFQSLSAELVTITNVTALGRQAKDHSNTGPHLWVYGNWPVTGRNARGGLTVTKGDANPETLILFDPVDGTRNPNITKLGDSLTDVTGVIEYVFGLYYIRPSTAPSIKSSRSPSLPSPSAIKSNGRCNALSIADYNLEDFAPGDSRIALIVNHTATYLGAPSLIFLQGVQDSSGPTDDGTVDANLTLSNLTQALRERTGIPYDFIDVDPVDNADGFEYGSNIRSAYIFNPLEVRLHNPNPDPGNSSLANSVLPGPSLRFNPGRIDAPPVFDGCRKPLVAHWETIDQKGMFFTVNVQWKYKDALTTLDSDYRPPTNPWIDDRNAQANVTGSFIAQIVAQDKNAAVIAAGDFNEYAFVEPMKRFARISKLHNMDVLSGMPEPERYTSTSGSFAYGSQDQLTHMFVSPSIARHVGKDDFEHVHVNTWPAKGDIASDYDPSIARLNVCRHLTLRPTTIR
ncbi:MAG: hypothetical protein Q9172_001538 [Xanthocarpia lactea]